MEAAIDREIKDYLIRLNNDQKEAILAVMKNFIPVQSEANEEEYSDELKRELDDRYEEYQNGGALLSEAEVKKSIKQIINGEN